MRVVLLGATALALGAAGPASAAEAIVGVFMHDATFIGEALGVGAAGREEGSDLHLGLRIDFGSKLLFQPELSLGYRFDERWSTELSGVHISNAQIFARGKNQGMDDVGVRMIRRF